MPKGANTSMPRAAPPCRRWATAHPDVLAAMHAQLDQLAYAHTSFFTTDVAEQLADELIGSRAGRHEPCLPRERRF
jgi:hypothetical protein